MKRFIGVAAVLGFCALGLSSPATAAVPPVHAPAAQSGGATAAAAGPMESASATGLEAPYAREVVRFGQRDISPYQIAHVLELQYRLKWVGLYTGTPSGNFGKPTEADVKAFQARRNLAPTGVATAQTWALLLHRTIRHPSSIPATCKTAGWHACYDRSMHQVTLWANGSIYNTWLVRGGGYTTQTRLGTHQVYYRDINHVSGIYGTPMPYSQFFDGGEALHGSRLMMSPFVGHSHGCINMYVEDARQLWSLTSTKTLWVTVYGSWS